MSPARLSVAATLLAGAVYVVAAASGAVRELERSILQENPAQMQRVLEAGVIVVINPVTVATAGLLAMRHALRADGMRAAAGVAIALLGALLLADGLKAGLGALDPLGGEARRALGRAFLPSGHAAVAMTLGLIAIRAAPPDRRRSVAFTAGVATGAYGCLLFTSSNHHPLDVVGGALVAVAWSAALVAVRPDLAGLGERRTGTGASLRPAREPAEAPLRPTRNPGGTALRRVGLVAGAVAVAGLTLGVALAWRPLLVAAAICVTLTMVGLTLAFESTLARVPRLSDERLR